MNQLTDKDISEILNGDDSELDMSSDEEELTDVELYSNYTHLVEQIEVDDDDDDDDNEQCGNIEDNTYFINDDIETSDPFFDVNITPPKKIKWIKTAHFEDMLLPKFEPEIPSLEVLSPINFFRKYIPEDLIQTFVENTNLYATRKDDFNFKPTNIKELDQLIGLHLMMGILQYPRVNMYWDSTLRNTLFTNTMTLNRFFKLRNYIHCVDNDAERNGSDKLWKVRPIYDNIKKQCNQLFKEENVCVDEQIVPFKGQTTLKVYMRNKPHPWEIKVFLLCGASGLAYDFLIYQGKTTEVNPTIAKKYGATNAVVLHLIQELHHKNHRLFCDNYFMTYPLIQICSSKSIWITGTIRTNRFGKPPLSQEKTFVKHDRGYVEEVVSKDRVVLVRWLDNKSVSLASNCLGGSCSETVRRWDRKIKSYVNIQIPNIVREYKHSMGGVDKLNCLLSLYRIKMRTRKWTLKMIFNAVDFAVTNSWLEYQKACNSFDIPSKKRLDLMHFRMNVAESLITADNTISRSRGRPSRSSIVSATIDESPRGQFEKRPVSASQYDQIGHFPEHTETRTRCKYPNCSGKGRWKCNKCNIHLCLDKDKNCFFNFHVK